MTIPKSVHPLEGELFVHHCGGRLRHVSPLLPGLGPSTNLNDQFPWGLWIGFDVICGVMLAAGGFTLTAAVQSSISSECIPSFARQCSPPSWAICWFHGADVRPGAAVEHLASADHANPHWVMFEVAWCVMLYTTVLALEFSPIPRLEHFKLKRALQVVRSVMVVFVILVVAAYASPPPVDFGRDIQPIFTRRCSGCHGAAQQMKGLRLDDRDSALEGDRRRQQRGEQADRARQQHQEGLRHAARGRAAQRGRDRQPARLDRRGREVARRTRRLRSAAPRALESPARRAARRSGRARARVGAQSDRRVRAGAAGNRRHSALARSRPAHAAAPRCRSI